MSLSVAAIFGVAMWMGGYWLGCKTAARKAYARGRVDQCNRILAKLNAPPAAESEDK